MSPQTLVRRLRAQPDQVRVIRQEVRDFAREHGAADPNAVALAVSEAVTNAIVHAYVDAPEPGEIEVIAQRIGDDCLEILVCDDGRGMLPAPRQPGRRPRAAARRDARRELRGPGALGRRHPGPDGVRGGLGRAEWPTGRHVRPPRRSSPRARRSSSSAARASSSPTRWTTSRRSPASSTSSSRRSPTGAASTSPTATARSGRSRAATPTPTSSACSSRSAGGAASEQDGSETLQVLRSGRSILATDVTRHRRARPGREPAREHRAARPALVPHRPAPRARSRDRRAHPAVDPRGPSLPRAGRRLRGDARRALRPGDRQREPLRGRRALPRPARHADRDGPRRARVPRHRPPLRPRQRGARRHERTRRGGPRRPPRRGGPGAAGRAARGRAPRGDRRPRAAPGPRGQRRDAGRAGRDAPLDLVADAGARPRRSDRDRGRRHRHRHHRASRAAPGRARRPAAGRLPRARRSDPRLLARLRADAVERGEHRGPRDRRVVRREHPRRVRADARGRDRERRSGQARGRARAQRALPARSRGAHRDPGRGAERRDRVRPRDHRRDARRRPREPRPARPRPAARPALARSSHR